MWFWRATLLVVLILAGAVPGASLGEEITDPFEVLSKYFEASGGLERLKAERTTYREGTLSVGGMQGTIKEWIQKPDRSRIEVDLGPIRIMQGDNGEISWQVDSNGKLQKTTKKDEATRNRTEVDRRIAEYEYADRNSDVFRVSLEGTEKVEGIDCYVVVVTNSINVDRLTHFIHTEGFRLEKSITIRDQESADIYYGDYREVDGISVAFQMKEVPHLTRQPQEVTWSHYESNPDLDVARSLGTTSTSR
jgi:hypothetical protein